MNYPFDAVIFDLDGVITKTALVHSRAWKAMFDSFLKEIETKKNIPFKEFTHEGDYLPYVDGKPRYQGVKAFLDSRNIDIPFGNPEDEPQAETVCGLGNRKNSFFNQILENDGVEVYPSTVELIYELKSKGIRVGVASSSKNCKGVLTASKIIDLFETRVDGEVSAEIGLKGKPEPDIFTTAADNLGVSYNRSVIVEDAISGVQAGKKGNFGLVLGIAREENNEDLYINGADIVVNDIGEIGFDGICKWFEYGIENDNWSLTYYDYNTAKERSRESLLAVGNGYFGTRGAMEESSANKINYPGTYMAGLYNRLISKVGDKDIENEDFVNATNWLPFSFKIDEGEYTDINNTKILSLKRTLDLRTGVLHKEMIIKDLSGKETKIISSRFASMDDKNIAGIEYSAEPLNYNGLITIKCGLSANHINAGVARYNDLNQKHLECIEEKSENNKLRILAKTTQSNILIGQSARIYSYTNDKEIQPEYINKVSQGVSEVTVSASLSSGNRLKLQKIVAIILNSDNDIKMVQEELENKLSVAQDYYLLISKSANAWKKLWETSDIRIEGDRLTQKMIRLHLYHLFVTTSPHNEHLDFSIPARGLHGEAYRGHIFWDEMFILPFYLIHYKEIVRSILMYRYRRLDEARKYALEYGYKGAMFPWQSGSSGREETQKYHLNPASGIWGDDHSSLQRHVSLAIAYNIIQYYHINTDNDFMLKYGAEMLIEICRFWESKTSFDENKKRYSIDKVMGPDEFHEMYPDAEEGGLKDNAYTNIMTIWMFSKTVDYLKSINSEEKSAIYSNCNLSDSEIEKWMDISRKIHIEISADGIISQYEGYFNLKELDWKGYKEKYGNIYRMDRILKAENLSPDEYKVAKQADTLMLFYNLNKEDVTGIFKNLGYSLPEDYVSKNLQYYLARTSHGSTLSRVVHSYLANQINEKELGWNMFTEAVTSDYSDIQGGTTAEGIHTGVMAGTVWIVLSTFAGVDLKYDTVKINPNLPSHWNELSFNFNFKGSKYYCKLQQKKITVLIESNHSSIDIELNNKRIAIQTNQWKSFEL